MRASSLFIPLFLLIIVLILVVVVFGSSPSSDPALGSQDPHPPAPLLTPKHDAIIAVSPDGTVYYVESSSGKILWSFSSGQSIYSSFQKMPNRDGEKLNASADGDSFYIDCGEDWELYLHSNGFSKVKLPLSADDMVKQTPFVSAGGGVMLGSKKTAVYLLDAKTGKVVQTFRSDNPESIEKHDSDETSSLTRNDIEEWLPTSTMNSVAIEEPLYVTRTDYALKYTSMKTGEVLWYLMFADIEASYECQGIENFLGGYKQSNKFRPGEGFDTNLPLNCKTRPVVYRIRDRSSLEPLFLANKMKDALPGSEVLSLPALDQYVTDSSSPLSYHDQHGIVPLDDFLGPHLSKNEILALPAADRDNYIIGSLPDNRDMHIDSPVRTNFWLPLITYAFVPIAMVYVLFRIAATVHSRAKAKVQKPLEEDIKSQNMIPKKRKARKSVVNNSSQNSIADGLSLLSPFDNSNSYVDGRKIGKLIVTNKEIAKGSNGTIVLEGKYDGRSVAVKRLVRSHHSVAVKEIQNLIASDQHTNIVRWYGVEYDQDFVYICLERCTCNLHELILACTSHDQVASLSRDHESLGLVGSNTQLLRIFESRKKLELWKSNGYPSAWLLKLMRDTVCGLAHLHELGIIHRDLKPQNVLVIKDRSISAKISDMGISKHLEGEMSSLTKNTTGIGSSGWQAPEQLRNERQSRAVDLFSLGCILFFCMTGGKHPFGENLERDINIVNDRKDLFLIDGIPEATNLISRLLDSNPNERPTAIEVTHHPLFWNSELRLSFLRDVSDRVELEDRESKSELLEALESIGKTAFNGKWDENLDTAFINDIGRYRRYKFNSVRDLLRVIRNKMNHYRELPKEIQAILGSVPEGFDEYFSTRFPKLLIEVYRIISIFCAEEETFLKYFKNTRL
ncbi:serine/threonine-protein kinase/endoribonuclease IRE1b-like [Andrographis paniculata]|uniref:serine/threonine-protein kinase/endoribonuclease IRE1b-like n=1 Tax=Andrographis paniculata TaxID=175694 RepID=UPI0021E77382|nr:serine/threonine-protein kinase/endoribonuclease IRE1b-like [Andrographis paniculata]